MSFATYFKASSYTMIAVAMLALVLAGGLHPALALSFAVAMIAAWKLEGTKWQLSERVGLVIVLLSIPLFFVDWQYQRSLGEAPGRLGVNALAHLIVFLSAIKLLQVKSDRDWVFLYLISFFEVLLAAGLSFSPTFLMTFTLYLLCALSTVIAFEIQKARRRVKVVETRLLVPPDSRVFRKLADNPAKRNIEAGRLPLVALTLLVLIFILALPLFLVAPRAGSATISRGGAGLTNFIGFSENVTLGEVGTLKKNNEIVMRVRVDAGAEPGRELKWRGVALDEFTGRGWKKSSEARRSKQELPERGFFRLGTTEALQRLTTQTVFLEPINSAVLFAAPRALAIQGDFPFIRVDAEGSVQSRPHDLDRIIYKAVSDTSEPDPDTLRRDAQPYPPDYNRYRTLPRSLDPRIEAYAGAIVVNTRARNRYDVAKAIESQLRSDYGYTLEMKAAGPDPLSDFLFNVGAGHCEYFSTAMAVLLRTQGMPARVVNGFLPGEYNEAAGAYTVRQSDAHSWVEVYFPETNSWVTFDPTPAAGRIGPQSTGFAAKLGKYAEALELMWFQYVVGYDKQEQRSLATSFHNQLFDFRRAVSEVLIGFQRRVPAISGRGALVVLGLLIIVLTVIGRRVLRLGWRRGLAIRSRAPGSEKTAIEFYQRLTELLARRGVARPEHQTPLEFAAGLGLSEALTITRVYNQVRFGGRKLSAGELREIGEALLKLEAASGEW
jgi:transglutaminase-like putative cysteine protease